MNKNPKYRIFTFLLGLVVTIAMVACAPEMPTATEQLIVTSTITAEMSETTSPQRPSPTPNLAKVIFVISAESDPLVADQLQQQIASLAMDAGLELEIVSTLTSEMLTSNVRIVVGIGPGLNLDNVTPNNPDISFLVIDQTQVALTDNISQVGDPIYSRQKKAFMAGYLAALISTDYKIAALVPSDVEQRDLILDSFVTGARFFCGICRPKYPPYNSFPQWETIPSEDANEGFQTAVDGLINQGVEVLFVSGDLASPALLSYLTEAGIKVVGDAHPEQIRNNWVGTIGVDYGGALSEIWPQLVDGTGGVRFSVPITLSDRNLNLVSEGRYRVFQEIAADLEAGLIAVDSIP
jgi:basic membrane lipoprotein Med (substrate-binding protein (PBP1-ABC) superfamily)